MVVLTKLIAGLLVLAGPSDDLRATQTQLDAEVDRLRARIDQLERDGAMTRDALVERLGGHPSAHDDLVADLMLPAWSLLDRDIESAETRLRVAAVIEEAATISRLTDVVIAHDEVDREALWTLIEHDTDWVIAALSRDDAVAESAARARPEGHDAAVDVVLASQVMQRGRPFVRAAVLGQVTSIERGPLRDAALAEIVRPRSHRQLNRSDMMWLRDWDRFAMTRCLALLEQDASPETALDLVDVLDQTSELDFSDQWRIHHAIASIADHTAARTLAKIALEKIDGPQRHATSINGVRMRSGDPELITAARLLDVSLDGIRIVSDDRYDGVVIEGFGRDGNGDADRTELADRLREILSEPEGAMLTPIESIAVALLAATDDELASIESAHRELADAAEALRTRLEKLARAKRWAAVLEREPLGEILRDMGSDEYATRHGATALLRRRLVESWWSILDADGPDRDAVAAVVRDVAALHQLAAATTELDAADRERVAHLASAHPATVAAALGGDVDRIDAIPSVHVHAFELVLAIAIDDTSNPAARLDLLGVVTSVTTPQLRAALIRTLDPMPERTAPEATHATRTYEYESALQRLALRHLEERHDDEVLARLIARLMWPTTSGHNVYSEWALAHTIERLAEPHVAYILAFHARERRASGRGGLGYNTYRIGPGDPALFAAARLAGVDPGAFGVEQFTLHRNDGSWGEGFQTTDADVDNNRDALIAEVDLMIETLEIETSPLQKRVDEIIESWAAVYDS